MPQDAAIWDTDWDFQPQLTWMSEAMATPIKAPTLDWVAETGKPILVQTVSQMDEPMMRSVLMARYVKLHCDAHRSRRKH